MKVILLNRGTSYPSEQIMKRGTELGHTMEHCFYPDVQIAFKNPYENEKSKQFTITTKDGKDFRDFDAIIPRGPLYYRHIAQMIAMYSDMYGIKMLNQQSLLLYPIFDKTVQYALLAREGLPVVDSMIDDLESNYDRLSSIFGPEFVYKFTKGSEGKAVYKIKSQQDLDNLKLRDERLVQRYYMAQKFQPALVDYRIIVLGDKIVGTMKRSTNKEGEFRTNFSLGGSVEKADISEEVKQIALKATKTCACDYAGVDILFWEDKPYILEVNRYCHFKGFDQANNTSVADQVLEYLKNK